MSACKRGKLNPMYGRHWTERQRAMCGTKGKHLNLSEEQKDMLRERGKWLGAKRARPVMCVEDNTRFESATKAASAYGVSVSHLCQRINGRSKTCAGKHFVRIDLD